MSGVAGGALPTITGRSGWGGHLPFACAEGPQYATKLTQAILHHTVTDNEYGPTDSAAMIRAIWGYHVLERGYCDIAYNFLIDRYGQIFEGRLGGVDKPVIGEQSLDNNAGTTGIALLGTFTETGPPEAAQNALINLLAWKLKIHGVDPRGDTAVLGHRDLYATECPGQAFYDRLPLLRAAVCQRLRGM